MAVDFYLKLDGIQGEATNTGFSNQIQLLSWSWGGANVSSVAGTSGSGAGKVDLHDFNAMIYFDKSTPKLFTAMCSGKHISTGTLSAVKSGADNKPYLKVDFTEMFITNLQISASSEIPSVSLSFTYGKITIDYSVQDQKGNLASIGPASYDLKQNKIS
jgi:type VI secretion system secreted protein Hcp